MTRRYSAFVLRYWDAGKQRSRIEVEHIQSGEKCRADSIDGAAGWIASRASQVDSDPGPGRGQHETDKEHMMSIYRIVTVLSILLIIGAMSLQPKSFNVLAAARAAPPTGKSCTVFKKRKACAATRYDRLAKHLAGSLLHASGQAAAVKAVKGILKAVGIPIVSPKGKMEQAGTSAFYLYDFEVAELAQATRAGRTHSIDAASVQLASLKLSLRDGATLTSAHLLTALQQITSAAVRTPSKSASLVPLLLLNLGKEHHPGYDLAGHPDASAVQLDPVQMLLLEGDAIAPALDRQRAMSSRMQAINPCRIVSRWHTDAFTHKILFVVDALGDALPDMVATIHQIMQSLELSVTQSGPASQTSHYGPAGHEADALAPMSWQAQVVQEASIPPGGETVKCGILEGAHIPGKGPVPNETVQWSGLDDLPNYGAITGVGSKFDSITDAAGRSQVQFEMDKEEAIPGLGPMVTVDQAAVTAEVCPVEITSERVLPNVQLCVESAPTHWSITAHKPRGYQVHFHYQWTEHDIGVVGSGITGIEDGDVTLHVCGDDPDFPHQWQGTETWSLVYSNGTTYGGTDPAFIDMHPDKPWTIGIHAEQSWQIDSQILPGSPPQLQLHFTHPEPIYDQSQLTVTAPITEDTTDCPDNSASP